MEHRANWTDIVVNISQMTQLGFDHTCQTFRSLDVQSMFAAYFWLWVFNANRRQKYSNLILRIYVSLKFSWNWKSISADPGLFNDLHLSQHFAVVFGRNEFKLSRNFDGSRGKSGSSVLAATWRSQPIHGVTRLPRRKRNSRKLRNRIHWLEFHRLLIQTQYGEHFSIATSIFKYQKALISKKSTGRCLVQVCCCDIPVTWICIRNSVIQVASVSKMNLKVPMPVSFHS